MNPQHHTLTAGVEYVFTLDADYATVEILGDGTAKTWIRFGTTPVTVGADGAHLLPAAIGSITREPKTAGATLVRVISDGTPLISVTGLAI